MVCTYASKQELRAGKHLRGLAEGGTAVDRSRRHAQRIAAGNEEEDRRELHVVCIRAEELSWNGCKSSEVMRRIATYLYFDK